MKTLEQLFLELNDTNPYSFMRIKKMSNYQVVTNSGEIFYYDNVYDFSEGLAKVKKMGNLDLLIN